MKILHISPSAPFNDGWGYQDNLLPKYHAKMGHEVVLVVSNKTFVNGALKEVEEREFFSQDGFKVVLRKKKKYVFRKLGELFSHIYLYDILVREKPDFVFCHGLSNLTIFQVIKYKKKINKDLIIVEDNHADFNIGAKYDGLYRKVVRTFWRKVNKITGKHISKVYGVTPWRIKYAESYYNIPEEKLDLLIMGADDEKLNFDDRSEIRNEVRMNLGVEHDTFLIVTGGKIDKKKKIDILMKACAGLESVKLVVFGNVLEDIKEDFNTALLSSDNIKHIGWIGADKVYDYFFAADLVFFPGQHSVLWEQACASKCPCVFEKWEGMDHVDNGGNSAFIVDISEESIKEKIQELLFTDKYFEMKKVAESEATNIYLYSKIAEKSIECSIQKD